MTKQKSILGDKITTRFEIKPCGGFDEHITIEMAQHVDLTNLEILRSNDAGRVWPTG